MNELSTPHPKVILIQSVLIAVLLSLPLIALIADSDAGSQILSDNCSNAQVDDIRSQVYIADTSQGNIQVIDTWTQNVKKSIPVGVGPFAMDISPNGSELYVALSGENRIAVIDLGTLTVDRFIHLTASPYDLKAGAPGRVYVTIFGVLGYPRIIDTFNNTEIGNITDVGMLRPNAFLEISQDRKTLFIGDRTSNSGTVYKFSLGDKTATYVRMGVCPFLGDLELSSDGTKLFVPCGPSNFVEILETSNLTLVRTINIDLFKEPVTVALVHSEKYLLVGYTSTIISSGGVAIYLTSTGDFLGNHDFGKGVVRMRATENGSFAYCFTDSNFLRTLDLTPTALIGINPGYGRSTVTFAIAISSFSNPYGSSVPPQYRCDWDSDGVWDTAWSSSSSYQHKYPSEGNYPLLVGILDGEGRVGRVTKIIHVDDSPPSTDLVVQGTPGNSSWYVSTVLISFPYSDAFSPINSTLWRVDGEVWTVSDGSLSLEKGGKHSIEYYSTDVAGNREATHNVSVWVDTSPPVVTGSGETFRLTSSSPRIPIEWSDDSSGVDRVIYSVDDGAEVVQNGSHPVVLSGIEDGGHRITLTAIDSAGNSVTVSSAFIVDTNFFSTSGPVGPLIIILIVFGPIGLVSYAAMKNRKRIGDWITARETERERKRSERAKVRSFLSTPAIMSNSEPPVPMITAEGSSPTNMASVTCSVCGSLNLPDSRYCGMCKADLRPTPVSVPPTGLIVFCKKCGNPYAASINKCPRCGQINPALLMSNSSQYRRNKGTKSIIGLFIVLASGFIGILSVFWVYSMVPEGYALVGWFSAILLICLIAEIFALVLSCYALIKSDYGTAVAAGVASIIAGLVLVSIFILAITLSGLILIVKSKDEFYSENRPVPFPREFTKFERW